VPAYKLFEVVEGAVFVGETGPNVRATAELTLTTPLGRTLYRVFGRADASGRLQLRPLPERGAGRPAANGPCPGKMARRTRRRPIRGHRHGDRRTRGA